VEIVQILGFALIAAVLLVVVREQRPEIAMELSIAAGAMIFLMLATRIASVVQLVWDMAREAGIGETYVASVLKIVGIAYITQFGAEVCRDAKESAIAAKVELAGKVLILLLAVPIVRGILETVIRLLS